MANAYYPGFASAGLQVVLDKVLVFMLGEIRLILGANDVLKKLERTLFKIQAMLDDVENKQISHKAWQIWQRDLKDAAYEADDMLDELAMNGSRNNVHDSNQVRNPLSSFTTPHKMNDIQKKLDDIAREMEFLYQNEFAGATQLKIKERPQTSSLINESCVFGREGDKEKVIDFLKSNESGGETISIVSIGGMGGIGKTTLAQLVYNDVEVCKHFELKMWVCVNAESDVRRLTKSIIESATQKVFDLMDLDPLQITLTRLLADKRFLLVLDNVWNENYIDWDVLQAPLRVGANGSKILVTTRSQIVSSSVVTARAITLQELDYNNSWLLFKRRAFEIKNLDAHPNLVAIGKEIVKKCKGLPLAAKTLGSLLNSTMDEKEWNIILKSEIWDFPEDKSDILPALRLSYQYLPAQLKQCFAYCSIFPKGYEFEKDKLVLLWMAEGFIQPKERKRMEDIGSDYFDNLLRRSFFQVARDGSNKQTRYQMHDFIHNLAQFVSDDEYSKIEDDNNSYISRNVRHLSLLNENTPPMIFKEYQSLRTILLLCKHKSHIHEVPVDLFTKLKCLRVLDLSGTRITELPFSIGTLKHLRYLDLSMTLIEVLHKSVCSLYYLQTLKLKDCEKLLGLPKNISNLINLRHLDLQNNLKLNSMPPNIGNLTSLQTLNAFVAGVENGCKIGEMKRMKNLQGTLCILKLENVVNMQEAEEAALDDKEYLQKLKLRWSDDLQNVQAEQEVLEGLKPHKNLKELQIEWYGGVMFPSWVGQPSSNIVTISLINCRNCIVLPSLGQLRSLKSLHIANMHAVKSVDGSFCGADTVIGFPSLETLVFDNMVNLLKWDGVKEGDIPRLRRLTMSYCCKITALPMLVRLGTLQHFEISHCYKLPSLPEEAVPSSLEFLTIKSCSLLKQWYDDGGKYLHKIEIIPSKEIEG